MGPGKTECSHQNKSSVKARWRNPAARQMGSQVCCKVNLPLPAHAELCAGPTGPLRRHGRSRKKLTVDPDDAPLNPLLHPLDFFRVGFAHELVRVDELAEDRPALVISDLGLVEQSGKFVDPRENFRRFKMCSPEFPPAIDSPLREFGVLEQPFNPGIPFCRAAASTSSRSSNPHDSWHYRSSGSNPRAAPP